MEVVEVIQLVSAGGTLLIAFLALCQLKQMRESLDDSRKWNKLNTAFTLLPNKLELSEIEKQLNTSCVKLIDRNCKLSESELTSLFESDNSDTRILLKNYLNELESYCTAVNMKVADKAAAKRKYGHKIIRHYLEMLPYIEKVREEHNSDGLFCEMELLVKEWTPEKKAKGGY